MAIHDKTIHAERRQVSIDGMVQGLGFRPFVCRRARELGLGGWVANHDDRVVIEAEGGRAALDAFVEQLRRTKPTGTVVGGFRVRSVPASGESAFEIRPSRSTPESVMHIAPDLATCEACLRELRDPGDRRYRYPFVACAACGPRFSILRDLPYDRSRTTMEGFPLCPLCRAEFEDPADRRFHAQTLACPECGPRILALDREGRSVASGEDALRLAGDSLSGGAIVAVRGIGGFHLFTDARNENSVQSLRERKHRLARPFAVMFPSFDSLSDWCLPSPVEARLLASPAAPIVLIRPRPDRPLAPSVSCGSREVGALLPYTPLHHLILDGGTRPLVATSGNLSGEPLITEDRRALEKLSGVADLFLTHDRPIARPIDDSLVRAIGGGIQVLRRARGLSPIVIRLPGARKGCLAVGGHLKNTIGITDRGRAMISPHLGDLDDADAFGEFRRAVGDLQSLSRTPARRLVSDAHPDYRSSRHAETLNLPHARIPHHYAHARSVMAENGLAPPVLGVVWDGGGLGTDGTIWGGEFLEVQQVGWRRAAHLLPFPLPGGEAAVREPWRVAAALLRAAGLPIGLLRIPEDAVPGSRVRQLARLEEDLWPRTSSVGRLFDGVASILGIRHVTSFEGQAAMELEAVAGFTRVGDAYPLPLIEADPILIDWRPMIRQIVAESGRSVDRSAISARFHTSLIGMLVAVAQAGDLERVALSGGCFQNRRLSEHAIVRLRRAGFRPYWHRQLPPNDGGLALGQLAAAAQEPV